MPVNVRIPTQLRELSGGAAEIAVDGATVAEVLKALEAVHPGFGDRLFDESGSLRRTMKIAPRNPIKNQVRPPTRHSDAIVDVMCSARRGTSPVHRIADRKTPRATKPHGSCAISVSARARSSSSSASHPRD